MNQNIADQRRANCSKDWGAGFVSSHLYLSLEVTLSLIEGGEQSGRFQGSSLPDYG